MAFNMKRPIIKGSVLHKQAKSIVSQDVSRGDAGLMGAAEGLGRSRVGGDVSYKIKNPEITFEKSKKKNLTEEEIAALEKIKADKEARKQARRKARNDKKNKPEVKNKKEKEPKVKKDTWYSDVDEDGNVISRGWQSIKEKIRSKREQNELDFKAKQEVKLNERLRKAEEGPDSGYDFSQIENQPTQNTTSRSDKYISPGESTKQSEELLSRTKASRNKKLQDAVKKYNVKVEDLEAKEIDGKREFFPKQGAVGGGYGDEGGGAGSGGTQWDDNLGRFKIPSGGISEKAIQNLSPKEKMVYDKEMGSRAKKQAAELQALRPKQDNIKQKDLGDLPSMVHTGDITLDPVTNQYEYTEQYLRRNQPKVEPVVEKINNELPQTLVKPKKKDYSTPTQHFRAMQKYYKLLEKQKK